MRLFRATKVIITIMLLVNAAITQTATTVSGGTAIPISNNGSVATQQYKLVMGTGNPTTATVAVAGTPLNALLGICAAGCGVSGVAQVVNYGLVSCTFDNATIANDTVALGSGGDCHDTGSTIASGFGVVQSTNAAPGTYTIVWTQQPMAGVVLPTNNEYSLGQCTTAATINPANGNRQTVTLTAGDTCALTFTQPVGYTVSVQLKVVQDTAGSTNGTISGGKWPGGAVPTITPTSAAVDIISCYLDGTNAYCAISQNFQ